MGRSGNRLGDNGTQQTLPTNMLERARSMDIIQTVKLPALQQTYRRAKTSTGILKPGEANRKQSLGILKKSIEKNCGNPGEDLSALDLNAVPFQGRTKELKKLRSCFTNALESRAAVRALVEGPPGSGKSALLKEFLQGTKHDAKQDGLMHYCLFKEGQAHSVSVIAASFANLLTQAHERDPGIFSTRFSEESLCNLRRLAIAFPNSIGKNLQGNLGESHTGRAPDHGFQQLDVSFRNLLHDICQYFHVVLILEDIHNAGHESAQIMNSLWTVENSMFIGSRSVTRKALNDKDSYRGRVPLPFLEDSDIVLQLQDFDRVLIAQILRKLLRLKEGDNRVGPLADLARRKTGGNAALVIDFIGVLHEQQMIYWHMPSMMWKWELETIRANTEVADSVLEMIADRLKTLPKDIIPILSMASFVGSLVFDARIVQQTLEASDAVARLHSHHELITGSPSLEALESKLKIAVEKGVLEGNHDGDEEDDIVGCGSRHRSYKFSHQKIWASARKIIPQGIIQAKLHYNIGRQLRGYYNLEVAAPNPCPLLVDKLLQIAIHHSNLGASFMTTAGEQLEVVELNEKAALAALHMWSYSSAQQHLENAISFLLDDKQNQQDVWKCHYDLLLRLKGKLVKVLMACGKLEDAIAVAKEVQQNARAVEDKCPVTFDLIYALVESNQIEMAMKANLLVLKELGHQVPRHFLKINLICLWMRIKKQMKELGEEHWLQLPATHDTKEFDALQLLHLLGDISLRSGNYEYKALGMLLFTKANIQAGCRRLASITVAFGALCNAKVGDIEEAVRCTDICIKLVQEFPEYESENSKALTIIAGYIAHQKQSYAQVLDSSLQAYQLALKCGDTQCIMYTMIVYSATYYHSGLVLKPLYRDMNQFMKLLQDYGQKRSCLSFTPFLQFVAHLTGEESMGKGSLPGSNYLGSILTQKHLDELRSDPQNARPLHYYRMSTMILAYLFGDLDTADEMSRNLCPEKHDASFVWLAARFLYQGLIAYSLNQRKKGKRYMKKLKGFVRSGNPNCHHMFLLLKAEHIALTSSPGPKGDGEIRKAYDEAIRASQRLGYLHHAALANERAGECLLDSDDPESMIWAESYILKAFQLYGEWGATPKCRQLVEKYDEDSSSLSMMSASIHHLSGSFQSSRGSSIRARARVTEETIAKEQKATSRNVKFLSFPKQDQSSSEPSLISKFFQLDDSEGATEGTAPLSSWGRGALASFGRRGGAGLGSSKPQKSRRDLFSKENEQSASAAGEEPTRSPSSFEIVRCSVSPQHRKNSVYLRINLVVIRYKLDIIDPVTAATSTLAANGN